MTKILVLNQSRAKQTTGRQGSLEVTLTDDSIIKLIIMDSYRLSALKVLYTEVMPNLLNQV